MATLRKAGHRRNPRSRALLSSEERPPLRGTTLFEMIITLIVVGILSGSVVPLVRWCALDRREAERRLVAREEVGNVLERIAALPWDELRQDVTASWKVSAVAAEALPEARLSILIADAPDATPPGRCARVELAWKTNGGHPVAPVRVVAWFHPPEGRP